MLYSGKSADGGWGEATEPVATAIAPARGAGQKHVLTRAP
jgi:hypothetical protein